MLLQFFIHIFGIQIKAIVTPSPVNRIPVRSAVSSSSSSRSSIKYLVRQFALFTEMIYNVSTTLYPCRLLSKAFRIFCLFITKPFIRVDAIEKPTSNRMVYLDGS
jgi:hypothetical protein